MDAGAYQAIGEFGGSVVGMLMAQGKYDEVRALREKALKEFGDDSLPNLEKLAQSAYHGVEMDPRYKSTQDSALERLMGIATSGGMDAQAKEKLQLAKDAALSTTRGLEGSALSSMARKGMLNTGSAAAASSRAAQAGVDRSYRGSISAASDASERALQALMGAGNMAHGFGQSDLAQKNLAAGADDRIAEFNAGIPQQKFNNKMQLGKARLGIYDTQADDANASAERTKRDARGLGRGAGSIAGYATSGGDQNQIDAHGNPIPPPTYEDEWQNPYKKDDEG